MRLLVALIAAVVVLVVVPASAKEGVRARLDTPVRLSTPPGKTIRVAWRLVDPEGRPFGAGGIYLRVSRCGRDPLRIPATARGRGRYVARLKVPEGGLRRLAVGLEGWRIANGKTTRADATFPFDPPLVRSCK